MNAQKSVHTAETGINVIGKGNVEDTYFTIIAAIV
jgi:hypothetical protein